MAIPIPLTSAWLKVKNVITVVDETTTLPWAGAEEPCNHPMTALGTKVDHPEEISGQGTTQMTGADQADPSRCSPHTTLQAIALPTILPHTSPTSALDAATDGIPLQIQPGHYQSHHSPILYRQC